MDELSTQSSIPSLSPSPSIASTSSQSPSTADNTQRDAWELFEDAFFSCSATHQSSLSNLKERLEALSMGERLYHVHENVLNFWTVKKLSDEDLGALAEIALAVPATQSSVERAFSGLHSVLSPQRTKLSDQHLDDILIT